MTMDQSRELLIKACKTGDLRTVKKLSKIVAKSSTHGGAHDLANFKYEVKKVLAGEEDASPNMFNNYQGNTPLHIACINGQVDVAELLIRSMNARVDELNSRGETPLHLACMLGHKGVIERLLLARASANVREARHGNTPLHILAAQSTQDDAERRTTADKQAMPAA